MAKLLSRFNSNDHEEMKNFDTIPPGWYKFKVFDSDMVENSKKTGSFLKLEFDCLDEKFKKRKHWVNLNLDNPKEQAVEIAESELASIVKACGLVSIEDSNELHGKELMIKLKIEKGDNKYPDKNKSTAYKQVEGVANPNSQDDSEGAPAKKQPKVSFD